MQNRALIKRNSNQFIDFRDGYQVEMIVSKYIKFMFFYIWMNISSNLRKGGDKTAWFYNLFISYKYFHYHALIQWILGS